MEGVPLEYACLTLFCEPVTITKSTCFINSLVKSFEIGEGNDCIRSLGALILSNSVFIHFNNASKTFDPEGEGETIIAFLPFTALMILLTGVAAGFVAGVTAATTPTGFAISIIPLEASSSIIPTVFLFFRSLNKPTVFLLFFIILSSTFPNLVVSTESSAIFLLLVGLHIAHATAVTTSSTCF